MIKDNGDVDDLVERQRSLIFSAFCFAANRAGCSYALLLIKGGKWIQAFSITRVIFSIIMVVFLIIKVNSKKSPNKTTPRSVKEGELKYHNDFKILFCNLPYIKIYQKI